MNNATMRAFREAAEMAAKNKGKDEYILRNDGHVIMFGISKERAELYSKYYKNPTIERM